MPVARHCRHCLGDCPGDCLLGESGRCIHGWNTKRPTSVQLAAAAEPADGGTAFFRGHRGST